MKGLAPGTKIEVNRIEVIATYAGKTFCFCSDEDKAKFEKNPKKCVRTKS